MKKKILISTGGSGGHVVPATILYQHLKDLNEVSVTCDNRGLKFLNQKDYDLTIFNINPFKKNFFLLPLNIFKILFLTIKSFAILAFLIANAAGPDKVSKSFLSLSSKSLLSVFLFKQ